MPRQGQVTQSLEGVPLRYTRETQRLYCRGIDLNSPIDNVKDGHYPILENLRSYTDGIIQPRQGITQVAANVVSGKTPVHSIRRLNNKLNNTYTRIIGVGNALANGQTSFVQTQYNSSNLVMSGNPLAMSPWRPSQSPVSWMYVADSSISAGGNALSMIKLTYDGSSTLVHQAGLPAPTSPPIVELSAPGLLGISIANSIGGGIMTSTTGWAPDSSGVAGAVSHTTRITAITITSLLHDSGSTGWLSIVPSTMANIGPGTILVGTQGLSTYYMMVYEVYRAGAISGNTVSKVIYDNNPTNTGSCTVAPSASVPEIKRNAVVLINGTNYYRITEVISSPNNTIVAFKINTGATTISAGQSLTIASSFRAYDVSGALSTDTLSSDSIVSTFAPSGGTLIGGIVYTPGSPLDMSQGDGTNGINELDYIHYSFKCADLSQIVQGRLIFDVDDKSFAKNCYYRAFTPSDLVAIAKGSQTILGGTNTQVQNRIITKRPPQFSISAPGDDSNIGPGRNSSDFSGPAFDNPDDAPTDKNSGSPRDQTGTGDNQWSEIRCRKGDFTRVGTDWSKGWQSVQAIKFEITLITGAVSTVMEFSSLNQFGGGSLDIGDIGAPYIFRYRWRCSTTGALSNWSPATRDGVVVFRNGITVSGLSAPSNCPEVDKIDVQRLGGLVTDWANIGTGATGAGYSDTSDDDYARGTTSSSEQIDQYYQPWLIPQKPATGTASTVAGTMLKDSGTNFNVNWAKGTPIKVGSFYTSLRRVLSTSVLEVEDCLGALTNSTWEIAEPFIASQPLPCFWGPFNGWFFGCGDSINPGRLYWTNQNNPDGTQDTNWLEVTGPSEPLQNGCVYNGRCYVFTPERMLEIIEISPGAFISRDVPTGKGLMYRWSFAVGPHIWFLSKDGIYETDGGVCRSMTFDTLFPLFPREGKLGVQTNGFFPPNMTTGNITVSGLTSDASIFFRMAYYDNYLYFNYPDTNNRLRCLVYAIGNFASPNVPQSGWFPDVYNPGGTNTGIICHYGEEGDGVHSLLLGGADTTSGILYSYGGTTDNGTAVSWHFRQGSYDAGDRRADKLWGDFICDVNPGTGTIAVNAGINNYGSTLTLTPANISGAGRNQTVFDINSGNGAEGRNLAVDLAGTTTDSLLYLIEPSFTSRPENSFLRAIQYDDSNYEGEKFYQGIEIEADTLNQPRTIQIQSDGGTLQDTVVVQHNGRLQKPYSFTSGFVAHMVRMLPTDSNFWKLFKWRWVWEPEPPLVTVWDTQQTSFGHVGFIHMKAIWITHTSTANLTLTITRMDDNTSQSYTIPSSAGVRGKEFYLLLGPASFIKGKTYKFKITQASNIPFRIYQRHCGVLVKPWASAEQFARWTGWGADSGDGLAQI